MALKRFQNANDTEASVFAPQWDILRNRITLLAHWNKPRWGLFSLLVFTGNVIVASLAWIIVWAAMR